MPRAPWATLSLLLVASLAACGDDDTGNREDGGQPGVHRLVILTPPGRSIGLAPSESSVLRVTYLDPLDRPVDNAQVGFAIQGSAEGAILGGYHSYTDSLGTAEMLLTAGSAPTRFTVAVTAPQALSVLFEVAVSRAGFATLELQPAYRGSHSLSDFATLGAELRFDAQCADVHPLGATPADRERSLNGFDSLAVFENVPMDLSYAVSVRAVGAAGQTLAWGCTDLATGQLVRGATMRLHLLAEDLKISASGRYSVLSTLTLPPEGEEALRAAFTAFLPTGACPHGPEQLLLDCLVDAAYPDGAADCSVNSTDPVVADLELLRGLLGTLGCREEQTSEGQPALEQMLAESLDATGVLRLSALNAFLAVPLADLTLLELRSELSLAESPEPEAVFAWHELKSVCFPGIGPELWVLLGELGAMPLAVWSLPSSRTEGSPPRITLPPHGLSLQPGWAALHAAWQEHLQGVGMPRDPRYALPLLLESYQGPPSAPLAQGCEAAAARLCEALGQVPSCLNHACPEALSLLSEHLGAGWDALPSLIGPDAMFATSAVLYDEDGDLQADRLGTPTTPADWLLTLRFGAQWIAPTSATFDATRLTVP